MICCLRIFGINYKKQISFFIVFQIREFWFDITGHTESSLDLKQPLEALSKPYWVIWNTWLQKQNLTKKITFEMLHCFINFYVTIQTHQFTTMSIILQPPLHTSACVTNTAAHEWCFIICGPDFTVACQTEEENRRTGTWTGKMIWFSYGTNYF